MSKFGHEAIGAVKETPPIELGRLGLSDISTEVLTQLESLYASSYHNTHMYTDLLNDMEQRPEVFQLFLARLDDSSRTVVGARVIESKAHPFIDYLGFAPIHGKRFNVLPDFRGRGIGKRFVDEGKRYCFEELGFKVLFGESNELGALSMYGREGALYFLDSIRSSSRRSSPTQNVEHFKEFITNPAFRDYRFPIGDGIQFIYCKDDATAQFFHEHGYVSKEELLGE